VTILVGTLLILVGMKIGEYMLIIQTPITGYSKETWDEYYKACEELIK